MNLFNVYPLFDIEPVRGSGCFIWDQAGNKYLDLYGGHAVVSVGHTHPQYVKRITEQLNLLGFYSNSVQNNLQSSLAEKLGKLASYSDYQLFLVNSGAEAIENALKVAAFHNQRRRLVVFEGAFHGRTAGAVSITHNAKLQSTLNQSDHVTFIPFNDIQRLEEEVSKGDVCAVIAEGIQGVGGIHVTQDTFWETACHLCQKYDTTLIADEVQSGYGRTGRFFAHQHAKIKPDIITIAKGMGNGFPIGGILIHPRFEPWHGMLGTTFGGNHLACAAGLAVLEIIEEENLVQNAEKIGNYLLNHLIDIPGIQQIRGRGLMIGLHLTGLAKPIREELLMKYHIFTGSSAHPNVLRLLPPLSMNKQHADQFLQALRHVMQKEKV